METMTEPLLGVQNICLRCGLHYGEHDPMLMPQPFNQATPHLMCIRFPGSGDNMIFWMLPDEDSFESIPGQALSTKPLGHLPTDTVGKLNHEFESLIIRLGAPPPVWAPDNAPNATVLMKDIKVKEYMSRFRYLVSRLSSPAIFREAIMVWRIAQHILLELDAHITWLQLVAPQFMGPHSSWEVPDIRSVVGTLTDRPEVTENCYQVSYFFLSTHCLINQLLLCFSVVFLFGSIAHCLSNLVFELLSGWTMSHSFLCIHWIRSSLSTMRLQLTKRSFLTKFSNWNVIAAWLNITGISHFRLPFLKLISLHP